MYQRKLAFLLGLIVVLFCIAGVLVLAEVNGSTDASGPASGNAVILAEVSPGATVEALVKPVETATIL